MRLGQPSGGDCFEVERERQQRGRKLLPLLRGAFGIHHRLFPRAARLRRTPLAEDEQNELDDEPAAEVHFEGFPAGCVFPKMPAFVIKKWEFQTPPTAKDEENAVAVEAGAVEEDDSEDEQSDEVDNENDTQAAESDEAAEENNGEDDKPAELDNENDTQAAECDETADEPAAGAPISEADILLPPDVVPITEDVTRCWEELTSKERAAVRETFAMWGEMNDITGGNSGGGDYAEAVKELDGAEYLFSDVRYFLIKGYPVSLLHNEANLRKRINKAIDAIPGFRESEKFKELIDLYPTYKEIEQ